MKRTLALLTMLAGCAHFSFTQPPCNVAEADERMVDSCRFVGTVEGHTYFFGPETYENAKRDALLQAQELGATHVVMVAAAGNVRVQQVFGRAYQCPQEAGAARSAYGLPR